MANHGVGAKEKKGGERSENGAKVTRLLQEEKKKHKKRARKREKKW